MRFNLRDHQRGTQPVGRRRAVADQIAHAVVTFSRHDHMHRRVRIVLQTHRRQRGVGMCMLRLRMLRLCMPVLRRGVLAGLRE